MISVAIAVLFSFSIQAQARAPQPATPADPVRTVDVVGTDNMKFDVTTITAARGERLRIRLKSIGTMPKNVMAHNLVVLHRGVDVKAFNNAALKEKANDYIPPYRKDDVFAATGLAVPGETVEVTFTVPSTAGTYEFICSFPGHFTLGMRGTLVVK